MKRTLLSLLVLVAFALPVSAQMMGGPMQGRCELCGLGMGMGMGGMDGMMENCLRYADKIGLSDDQVKKIKAIHRNMKKKQAQFKADMEIAQVDMREIMDVKDFDLEKATAVAKKMGDMRAAHHLEMLKAKKEVRAILTEDQFKKLRKLMQEQKGKMGGKKPARKMMKQ